MFCHMGSTFALSSPFGVGAVEQHSFHTHTSVPVVCPAPQHSVCHWMKVLNLLSTTLTVQVSDSISR